MRADPTAQVRLVELAEHDSGLARLAHRRAHLPEQVELDSLVAERQAARESAARARIAVEDIDRAVTKISGDVAAVRRRRTKDEDLLTAGGLPARQVGELDHELGTLERRQAELETQELELLERREALLADVDHSGARVSDLDGRVDEAARSRDLATSDLDDEEAALGRRREQTAQTLPSDLLGLYTRLLAETGRGAGVLGGRRCSACGLELDRSSVSAFAAAAADEVRQCPECRAILVREAGSR